MSAASSVLICAAIVFAIRANANSMSGTFQSCSLQCDESGGTPRFNPKVPGGLLRGKQGPRGLTGAKGDTGAKGEAGQACDLEAVKVLQDEVADLGEAKIKLEGQIDDQSLQFKSEFQFVRGFVCC